MHLRDGLDLQDIFFQSLSRRGGRQKNVEDNIKTESTKRKRYIRRKDISLRGQNLKMCDT